MRPGNIIKIFGSFSYKATHMLWEINFKVFKKLLRKNKIKSITIDIDSSVVNVEGNQEAAKFYRRGFSMVSLLRVYTDFGILRVKAL